MGLLERFRPDTREDWHPPSPGICQCESHIEDLLDERIPLAAGRGRISAAELVAAGALTTFPSPTTRLYVEEDSERRGPFHWRVLCERALLPYVSPHAPIGLEDALFVQSGVERVWWRPGIDVSIGAPQLCRRGIQGAIVRALTNPRLRSA